MIYVTLHNNIENCKVHLQTTKMMKAPFYQNDTSMTQPKQQKYFKFTGIIF